jgi:hypothetical protein
MAPFTIAFTIAFIVMICIYVYLCLTLYILVDRTYVCIRGFVLSVELCVCCMTETQTNVNCVFVCDSDLFLFVYIHLHSMIFYLFHCIYYDSFYIPWIVVLYMDFIGMQIN